MRLPPATTTAVILPNVYNNFLLGAFGTSGGLYNPLGNYQYNPSPDIIVKAVWEPGFGHYEVGGVFSDFRDRVFPCVASTSTNTIAPAACCRRAPPPRVTDAILVRGAYNDNRKGGGVVRQRSLEPVAEESRRRHSLPRRRRPWPLRFGGSFGRDHPLRAELRCSGIGDGRHLAVIRSFQALGTLQLHPTPKLDINFYVGGEYEARTA